MATFVFFFNNHSVYYYDSNKYIFVSILSVWKFYYWLFIELSKDPNIQTLCTYNYSDRRMKRL